jgi:hypothetical protein
MIKGVTGFSGKPSARVWAELDTIGRPAEDYGYV